MSRTVYVKKLGLIRYLDALKQQKNYAQQIVENVRTKKAPGHKLLLLEHYPVYTVGLRSDSYPEEEEQRLKSLGADFHRTDRGGLITFHGPGQLVVYPILHLQSLNLKGLRWYVSALERTVIRCLKDFQIHAQTTRDTGIWIDDRKICAIGIQGREVTTHGLALNCNIDLTWFHQIVPCGLVGKSVTSISRELNFSRLKQVEASDNVLKERREEKVLETPKDFKINDSENSGLTSTSFKNLKESVDLPTSQIRSQPQYVNSNTGSSQLYCSRSITSNTKSYIHNLEVETETTQSNSGNSELCLKENRLLNSEMENKNSSTVNKGTYDRNLGQINKIEISTDQVIPSFLSAFKDIFEVELVEES